MYLPVQVEACRCRRLPPAPARSPAEPRVPWPLTRWEGAGDDQMRPSECRPPALSGHRGRRALVPLWAWDGAGKCKTLTIHIHSFLQTSVGLTESKSRY